MFLKNQLAIVAKCCIGSQINGTAGKSSDLDLTVLVPSYADVIELSDISSDIAVHEYQRLRLAVTECVIPPFTLIFEYFENLTKFRIFQIITAVNQEDSNMQAYQQLPTAQEAALAKLCSQELAAVIETKLDVQSLSLTSPDGQLKQVEIPVSALRLMVNILTELGEGNTVKLVPIHAELTTQEAADLLNVSRPTLIKLLDDGAIAYHRTGNRRKVRFNDLRRYQSQLETHRLKALEQLTQLDQELELGY